MASLSIEEQIKKYEEWEVESCYLLTLDIDELRVKASQVKESLGEGPYIPPSFTKQSLVQLILPNVAKPDAPLSYQRHNQIPGTGIYKIHPNAPPKIVKEDLYYVKNGKLTEKTIPMLKQLLLPRNLLLGGKKEDLIERLMQYNPQTWVPRKRKGIDRFEDRPIDKGLMRDLYDLVTKEVQGLLSNSNDNVAAGELEALRPHILQHYDQSFDYHIVTKKNYQTFQQYYLGGLQHWQGDHTLCANGKNCPRQGSLRHPVVIQLVASILKISCEWVTESTTNIWVE